MLELAVNVCSAEEFVRILDEHVKLGSNLDFVYCDSQTIPDQQYDYICTVVAYFSTIVQTQSSAILVRAEIVCGTDQATADGVLEGSIKLADEFQKVLFFIENGGFEMLPGSISFA
tara:strand:+ start:2970 stop:3317 length:348 start_codon:yes stop_codon:yes gene_type:complete